MPSLAEYRARFGQVLGSFQASRATSGTAATLVDGSQLIASSVASLHTYEDWYLLRTAASVNATDVVRVVADYQPSTGTFTPDLPWANAPSLGETYELHGLIEPSTTLTALLNHALERCWIPVEQSFVPPVLMRRHLLATQGDPPTGLIPYLRDVSQVRQAGRLTQGLSRDLYNPFDYPVYGEVTTDGAQTYLNTQVTFNGVDTVYLKTMARACDWLSLDLSRQPFILPNPAPPHAFGNGWLVTPSITKLAYDTDQAIPALDWVVAGALEAAWQQFAQILEPSANQRLIKDAAQAAAWFTSQTEMHSIWPPRTLRPLLWWGPLPR